MSAISIENNPILLYESAAESYISIIEPKFQII